MEKEKVNDMGAITNVKTRIATFRKRKNNLLKKAQEFAILCGVELFIIVYGPKCRDWPIMKPETWASEEGRLFNIINRYKERVHCVNNRAPKAAASSSTENEDDDEIMETRKVVGNGKFPTWYLCFDDLSEDQLKLIFDRVVKKHSAALKRLKRMRDKGSNRDSLKVWSK